MVLDRPLLAFVLGYVCSLALSYLINATWVFRAGSVSLVGYAAFCLSYVPNFLVQLFLVAALTRWLDVHPAVAYLLGVAVGVPVTFLILDRLTFGGRGMRAGGDH